MGIKDQPVSRSVSDGVGWVASTMVPCVLYYSNVRVITVDSYLGDMLLKHNKIFYPADFINMIFGTQKSLRTEHDGVW